MEDGPVYTKYTLLHILLGIQYTLNIYSIGYVFMIQTFPIKGELKAHIHISLYESNTLQEYDAVLLFL